MRIWRASTGRTTISGSRNRLARGRISTWPSRGVRLNQVFRLQDTRTVSNDWVVRYDNRLLQLERHTHRPPARSTVVIFEDPAGQLEIRYRDRVVRRTEIAVPVVRSTPSAPVLRPPQEATASWTRRRPSADHPWRRGDEHREREEILAQVRQQHRP